MSSVVDRYRLHHGFRVRQFVSKRLDLISQLLDFLRLSRCLLSLYESGVVASWLVVVWINLCAVSMEPRFGLLDFLVQLC